LTDAPRRTAHPGVVAAAFAKTASLTGRRAVRISKRSSSGRIPPLISTGTPASVL
jgi:hypothetical protein